jgi:hypothetical protein
MRSFIILISILIAAPAQAYRLGDGWNWKNSVAESVFAMEVGIDMGQTIYISDHPEYREINPLLHKHPSHAEAISACIIGAGVHALVSAALPTKYRAWWQGTTIIIEGANITRNKAIGIGLNF